MTVLSETGKVLYQEEYKEAMVPIEKIDINPREISLPKGKGTVLLITFSAFTAIEGIGRDSRFYGFRPNGSFGPITKILWLYDYEGRKKEIVEYKVNGTLQPCYIHYPWKGYVVDYCPLYLDGKFDGNPAYLDIDENPIIINEKEAAKLRKEGTIRLYMSPLFEAGIRTIKFRKNSRVKLLGAKYVADKEELKTSCVFLHLGWWLHVIIDDQEGYIFNESTDVELLGLIRNYCR
jgi:hypothetical protein